MTKRQKQSAVKAIQEVHAKYCPVDRTARPDTCGCAIGLVYRFVANMDASTK